VEANPYSAPSARVDTSPRTRRPKVTGNENYFRAATAHLGAMAFAVILWFLYGSAMASDLHSAWAYAFFAPFFLVAIAINIACWWGCKNRKEWARIVTLVLGFLSLIAFPVGTVIGFFMIRYSIKEWPEPEYYEHISLAGMPGQPEAMPPPLPPPMPAPAETA
jgi:hypothetical protein